MVLELRFGLMGQNMKDNGKIIKHVGKVLFIMLMGIHLQVNFRNKKKKKSTRFRYLEK